MQRGGSGMVMGHGNAVQRTRRLLISCSRDLITTTPFQKQRHLLYTTTASSSSSSLYSRRPQPLSQRQQRQPWQATWPSSSPDWSERRQTYVVPLLKPKAVESNYDKLRTMVGRDAGHTQEDHAVLENEDANGDDDRQAFKDYLAFSSSSSSSSAASPSSSPSSPTTATTTIEQETAKQERDAQQVIWTTATAAKDMKPSTPPLKKTSVNGETTQFVRHPPSSHTEPLAGPSSSSSSSPLPSPLPSGKRSEKEEDDKRLR